MKEIVINNCFGGFGLSMLAELEYLKLKGKKAYFYKDGTLDKPFRRVNGDDSNMFFHTVTKDLGNSPTSEEVNKYYFSGRDIERDDENLIKVVKKLKEKANGDCAELKIVKIPENIKWHIHEYDGSEHIAENHETWG